MATVRRFEDLECWREARKFVGLKYGITGCVAPDQKYINESKMVNAGSLAMGMEGRL